MVSSGLGDVRVEGVYELVKGCRGVMVVEIGLIGL